MDFLFHNIKPNINVLGSLGFLCCEHKVLLVHCHSTTLVVFLYCLPLLDRTQISLATLPAPRPHNMLQILHTS
jgi:hypothetical protein